jgi:drug/metabolite transporter (DMT)-like permease
MISLEMLNWGSLVSALKEGKEMESQDGSKSVKKISLLMLIVIQLGVILYTTSGICSKMTSNYPAFSLMWLVWIGLEVVALGMYAVFWQQIIKRVDLSVAYANRAFAIFWSTLWAVILFREKITPANAIGIVVIFLGIQLVNKDAE